MKLVIQRVKSAQVSVENKVVGKIRKGILVLLGVGKEDDVEVVKRYVSKMLKLRIFEDKDGLTNLSLKDVQGQVLVVSQFTLYADCRKGNRPSFTNSAGAKQAKELYEYFLELVKEDLGDVESGVFAADMDVELINDGPFTIILDEDL